MDVDIKRKKTEGKSTPCSPTRAASTAELSARTLVWKAVPSFRWRRTAHHRVDAECGS
jgi:hypothetical protein